jgi:hypothetical protein
MSITIKNNNEYLKDTKDNFIEIYNEIMSKKANVGNPDHMHDIYQPDKQGLENQLEGSRFKFKNNTNKGNDNGSIEYKDFERLKPGEVGQGEPAEQAAPFVGDAKRSQYDQAGGATSNPGMIGDQTNDKSQEINYHTDSMPSGKNFESKLNPDYNVKGFEEVTNQIGRKVPVARNPRMKRDDTKQFGLPVSRKNKGKKKK